MGEVADQIKHDREFERHVTVGPVESVREGWHEGRCDASVPLEPGRDHCYITTGTENVVEDAMHEHIGSVHVPECPECDASVMVDTAPEPPVAAPVNHVLRAYVTGSAFRLDLGKTHIETLVHIDFVLRLEKAGGHRLDRETWVRSPSLFSTATPGLRRRGLVRHLYDPARGERTDNRPFSDFWEITEAGKLVIALLKEAGIWYEHALAYPVLRP